MMKKALTMGAVAVLLFTCHLVFGADDTNSVATNSSVDYQSFRLISERNIFNPNRSGRPDRSDYRQRRETDRRSRSSSTAFGLIGTMSYEKGRFAFFDGTSSDYRKVLKPDESIAGYKVADIGANYVMLQGDGKEIYLEVGGRMRKQQEGSWAVSTGGEAFESFTPEGGDTAAEGDNTGSNTVTTAAPTGEVSDVIKRLMQKREQELK